MRNSQSIALVLGVILTACNSRGKQEPTIRDLAAQPIAPAADPVNQRADSTIDALVLTLTIDGTAVHLDTAVLARVPRAATMKGSAGGGDRVVVVGYAAGARISEANVPDVVVNAQEGVGVVRQAKRQVTVSLAAPRALDAVEVTAAATGAQARVDVRGAYSAYCKTYRRDNPYCPTPK